MKVIVLGAGITVLSIAWHLSKSCDVLVLEKDESPGGWLKTDHTSDFLFEKGLF